MGRDDRFKRYQEAGADFLEVARTRAEEFLEELARVGDSTQKQAQGALDELVGGSRKGTEQILATIRKEVTSQLALLGIATKDDLAALERRLTGRVEPATTGAASAAQKTAPAQKAAPVKKAAPAKKAAAKKAVPAKKAPAKKAPTEKDPAKHAAPRTPPHQEADEA
jgi:polyhydroxyalkanoate synthesis regulator phasin